MWHKIYRFSVYVSFWFFYSVSIGIGFHLIVNLFITNLLDTLILLPNSLLHLVIVNHKGTFISISLFYFTSNDLILFQLRIPLLNSFRPDRLFNDPFAVKFISEEALLACPESRPFNASRTKYFDDSMLEILSEKYDWYFKKWALSEFILVFILFSNNYSLGFFVL